MATKFAKKYAGETSPHPHQNDEVLLQMKNANQRRQRPARKVTKVTRSMSKEKKV